MGYYPQSSRDTFITSTTNMTSIFAKPIFASCNSLNTSSNSTVTFGSSIGWSSMSSCSGWSTEDKWRSVDSGGLCENDTGEQLSYQDIAEQHKEVCMLMKFLVYKGYVNEEEFDKFKNTFQKLEKL